MAPSEGHVAGDTKLARVAAALGCSTPIYSKHTIFVGPPFTRRLQDYEIRAGGCQEGDGGGRPIWGPLARRDKLPSRCGSRLRCRAPLPSPHRARCCGGVLRFPPAPAPPGAGRPARAYPGTGPPPRSPPAAEPPPAPAPAPRFPPPLAGGGADPACAGPAERGSAAGRGEERRQQEEEAAAAASWPWQQPAGGEAAAAGCRCDWHPQEEEEEEEGAEQPRGPPSRGGGAREDAGEAGLGGRRRRGAARGRRAAAAEAAEEGLLLLQHPAFPGVRVRPDAGPGHGGSLPGEWGPVGRAPPPGTCRGGGRGAGRGMRRQKWRGSFPRRRGRPPARPTSPGGFDTSPAFHGLNDSAEPRGGFFYPSGVPRPSAATAPAAGALRARCAAALAGWLLVSELATNAGQMPAFFSLR